MCPCKSSSLSSVLESAHVDIFNKKQTNSRFFVSSGGMPQRERGLLKRSTAINMNVKWEHTAYSYIGLIDHMFESG